ncbi:MAG: 4Fe-4S dicluster domain-containing protein [Planctomycetota bacterium]|jgi:heterodisulfide reductase subunit C
METSKQNNKEETEPQAAPQAKNQVEKSEAVEAVVSQLDLRFRDEIAGQPGGENIRRCFACGTCAAGCPVTEVDSEYNCRRIIRQILLGMRDEVLSSPLIWFCLVCYRCYVRCPQKVNFTDIMRVLRYLAVKEKRVSPEVFEQITKLDRFSQVVRHDLVKGFFENKDVSLEELESHVSGAMKEALVK